MRHTLVLRTRYERRFTKGEGMSPTCTSSVTEAVERAIAALVVAGDFNDWGTRIQRTLHGIGMRSSDTVRCPTYPSRLPVVQLDQIFARGLKPLSLHVPRGRIWGRMSDHLPLIGEFGLG